LSVNGTPPRPPAGGRGRHHGSSGEPLVCVHGITDTWRTWELVLPRLEAHHDVLAPTLLGHSGGGPLGPDGAVTLTDLVDAAERDMDAAGFATAHLVGNSLGGWIVLELAARGRARSVVAISPAGGWEAGDRRALRTHWEFVTTQRFLRAAEPLALRMVRRPRSRAIVLANLVSHPQRVPAPLATALVRGAADCPAALPLLAETRRGFPELGPIDVPVRIAWGTRDMILPYRRFSARLRRLVPDAEWTEIPGAGHLAQIDHPEEVADLVLEVTGSTGR